MAIFVPEIEDLASENPCSSLVIKVPAILITGELPPLTSLSPPLSKTALLLIFTIPPPLKFKSFTPFKANVFPAVMFKVPETKISAPRAIVLVPLP